MSSQSSENYDDKIILLKQKVVVYKAPTSKEEIKEMLSGFERINDMNKLFNYKPYTLWIRYYDTVKKALCRGGILKFIDANLEYIHVINDKFNYNWKINTNECIIFIKEYHLNHELLENLPKKKRRRQWKKQENPDQEKSQIDQIKDQLYILYTSGKLKVK